MMMDQPTKCRVGEDLLLLSMFFLSMRQKSYASCPAFQVYKEVGMYL